VFAFHPGAANIVFADGSVRTVRDNIKPLTLAALITFAGGEVIDGNDF
jgi:prepilin-type processing-associated H-X9-DG protein